MQYVFWVVGGRKEDVDAVEEIGSSLSHKGSSSVEGLLWQQISGREHPRPLTSRVDLQS